LGTEPSVNLDT